MKKLKFLFLALIMSLLFLSQGFAQTYLFQNNLKLVAQGTVTAANTQLSLVDGTAFVYLVGVDLSAYQTGKHLIAIYNSSTGLLIAHGYCSATAPGGETFGAVEQFSNGTFDANTDGWTTTGGVLSSEAGGFSNNCMKVLSSGGAYVSANESFTTMNIGGAYYLSFYHKNGDISGLYKCGNLADDDCYVPSIGLTHADWTEITKDFTAHTDTTFRIYLYGSGVSPAPNYNFYDEASLKQRTDCEVTGLQIVSAKSGATQNWLYKGTGAVNAAISYKIWSVGN